MHGKKVFGMVVGCMMFPLLLVGYFLIGMPYWLVCTGIVLITVILTVIGIAVSVERVLTMPPCDLEALVAKQEAKLRSKVTIGSDTGSWRMTSEGMAIVWDDTAKEGEYAYTSAGYTWVGK